MFIGHYGAALAAKKLAPRTSLGTLLLAAVFIDLVWPTFLLLGIEHARVDPTLGGVTPLDFVDYPWTHSLLAVCAWALALGAAYFVLARDRRGAWVVGALVASHWLLDAIVHRPDLLLLPGGHWAIGFGLWRSLAATLVVELGVFVAGVFLYLRATPGARRVPLWGFMLLLVIYVGSLFGPPPPSIEAVAWVGQAQWLLVLIGYAIDRPATSLRIDRTRLQHERS